MSIAKVADDWVVKGLHVHVGAIELMVRPGQAGTIVLKPVFSSAPRQSVNAAISQVQLRLADVQFRRQLHRAARRGLEYLRRRGLPGGSEVRRGSFPRHRFEKTGAFMKLTLREFLETGRLGDIRLGMTRAEAQALLGPPEDISLTKDAVWKYGSLQLYFHENRLWLIALYFPWDEFRLPNAFEAVGYLPSRETTLQEFRKFLAESGIETNLDRTVDEAVILQVGPGIEVIFHREPEQILLETMQWSGQPPVRERVKESR